MHGPINIKYRKPTSLVAHQEDKFELTFLLPPPPTPPSQEKTDKL